MIDYVIKSTVSITVLYLLYFLLLRNIKTFKFNRFYLLFAIIFSFTLPFIQITTDFNLAVSQNILGYSSSFNSINIQGTIEKEQSNNTLIFPNILFAVYILISTIILMRFVFNLYKIIKTIKNSKVAADTDPQIILSIVKTLPYSFLNYIIVNKTEFESGKIDDSLIFHEQAHCRQYHSIDIILIELVKIIFWFNPLIWIIKKEIQLNHEYLADEKVLKTQNLKDYQDIILNLVFRNNSTYLASNFNYSLTKKRLIMMTKNNSSMRSMVRKITIVPLVLILTVSLTFSQRNLVKENLINYDKEWWYPILEKHKIEPRAFNNFENIFEMGSSNSIENRIVTLTDALFIIRQTDGYWILKSPSAYHDLDKNTISGGEGVVETFKYDSEDTSPIEKSTYKKFIFELQKDKRIKIVKAEEFKTQVITKE